MALTSETNQLQHVRSAVRGGHCVSTAGEEALVGTVIDKTHNMRFENEQIKNTRLVPHWPQFAQRSRSGRFRNLGGLQLREQGANEF